MKIGMQKTVEVEVKTLKICAKCCDMCSASLHDQDGAQIGEECDLCIEAKRKKRRS